MKAPKALSAALLVASAILLAPAALAEQPRDIRVAFTFNPSDSAADIYSGLERTVRKACEFRGVRSLTVIKHEKACMKSMLDNGVTRLARPDVAAIHNSYLATSAG